MTRILIVDDIHENRYLMESLLLGHNFDVSSASNGAEALEIARLSPPDLIVSDILMPVMDGYALCRQCKSDARLNRIPFIFYTATYTEPEDEEFALSLGADRFVIKPQEPEELERIIMEVLASPRNELSAEIKSLPGEADFLKGYNRALFRKLEKKMLDMERLNRTVSLEIAERKKLEETLLGYEHRFQVFLDASPVAVAWADMQGNIIFLNKRFVELFGYEASDIPTMNALFARAYPDVTTRSLMAGVWREARDYVSTGCPPPRPIEVQVACGKGSLRHVSVVEAVISDNHVSMFSDLTARKDLETQLMRSQKMESIGQLTGGIAHDFNNILSAIMGYGHLLMTKLPTEGPSRGYVEQILRVSDHAANLTRGLFDFSRKQMAELKPVKLNTIVKGAQSFLSRLVIENIDLKISTCHEELAIMADPCQMEQILMNLVANARDAIHGSGLITIDTRRFEPDDDSMISLGLDKKGPYALLAVSDTGEGMNEETLENIFEPFFTTKEVGKGTGLGLAIVQGIVKRHNGRIHVRSEPGKGTIFSIYFPVLDISVVEGVSKKSSRPAGGTETILLAEDNEVSRKATALTLQSIGYNVLEAGDGEEALVLLQRHGKDISLLIVDAVMPKRSGWAVREEAVKVNPDIKAIVMSGYPEEVVNADISDIDGIGYLSKPVPPSILIARIRELLDSPGK
ncbi:MAG: response regulator [Geobacteraceae bacterium]|nr:response regulator [Geobacteraceae bacterium]